MRGVAKAMTNLIFGQIMRDRYFIILILISLLVLPAFAYSQSQKESQNIVEDETTIKLEISGAPPAGAGGSFPKRDIPRLAESIQPPAGAGGFLQRGNFL